ncbi:MAG: spore coat protein CotJB [Defluviitaleaceae bacterium]|nr:spore coat protein CotJB [Defluviitaleaceae bacterium]
MNANREEVLKKLSIVDFMLLDLGLYLNNNPTCQNGLALHNQASKDSETLRKQYEENFGPLRMCTENHASDWQWTKSPWPWESEANFKLN